MSFERGLIYQDDFVITPNNFTQKLNHFIESLPPSYDIAYLDVSQIKGTRIALAGNQSHISKFSQDANWYGNHAIAWNINFVKRLLTLQRYAFASDDFLTFLTQNQAEILGKTIETYVSTEPLSGIPSIEYSGHSSKSEITKMGIRSGHPTSQPTKAINKPIVEEPSKPQIQTKIFAAKARMLYDVAYIINLDRATERWARITKQFDEAGLPYQRFKAVDGYKVVLENIFTKHVFNGQDLKDKPALLETKALYQITCNPNEYLPTTFTILPTVTLTAGELGIWCSQRIIWQDIVNKKYQTAVIFEDDALIKVDDHSVPFCQDSFFN